MPETCNSNKYEPSSIRMLDNDDQNAFDLNLITSIKFIRACVEMKGNNPILSIHDQGAGGNGNVLKELVEGENGGAIIEADNFQLGDPTISIRELWGAEYQVMLVSFYH